MVAPFLFIKMKSCNLSDGAKALIAFIVCALVYGIGVFLIREYISFGDLFMVCQGLWGICFALLIAYIFIKVL